VPGPMSAEQVVNAERLISLLTAIRKGDDDAVHATVESLEAEGVEVGTLFLIALAWLDGIAKAISAFVDLDPDEFWQEFALHVASGGYAEG